MDYTTIAACGGVAGLLLILGIVWAVRKRRPKDVPWGDGPDDYPHAF